MGKEYHVTFTTKYRRELLTPELRWEVKSILINKAKECGCVIKCMEVLKDHVHLYIEVPVNVELGSVIKKLKGYSSYLIRRSHPELKEIRALWAESFASKVIDTLVYSMNLTNYIRTQYSHHKISES